MAYADRLLERIVSDRQEVVQLMPEIWELMPRAADPILGRRPDMNPFLEELSPEESAKLEQLCNRHYFLSRRIVRDTRRLREARERALRT